MEISWTDLPSRPLLDELLLEELDARIREGVVLNVEERYLKRARSALTIGREQVAKAKAEFGRCLTAAMEACSECEDRCLRIANNFLSFLSTRPSGGSGGGCPVCE